MPAICWKVKNGGERKKSKADTIPQKCLDPRRPAALRHPIGKNFCTHLRRLHLNGAPQPATLFKLWSHVLHAWLLRQEAGCYGMYKKSCKSAQQRCNQCRSHQPQSLPSPSTQPENLTGAFQQKGREGMGEWQCRRLRAARCSSHFVHPD